MTRSVLKGRCGPCCSIAPTGWTRIDRSLRWEAMSGKRRSSRWRGMLRSYGSRHHPRSARIPAMDHGAIVIGAGHNGLITATYLARAGIDTLLVEARDSVGGCASTVDDLGAPLNIFNSHPQ